jgi:two-component system response regulator AtoC
VQLGAPTPPRIFTVLLVDDEEQVRNVVSRMLQRAGYCVWLAASGSEALSILRTAPVDVVLSDIRMPGMNGLDLAREICRIWPWLRVALMSGYECPAALESDTRLSSLPFLTKPFESQALLDLLKVVTGEHAVPDP